MVCVLFSFDCLYYEKIVCCKSDQKVISFPDCSTVSIEIMQLICKSVIFVMMASEKNDHIIVNVRF